MSAQLVPGQLLQHFKGGRYKVLFHAFSADGEPDQIVYISLQDGKIWTRAADRFTQLVMWPDGVERARFIVADPQG